jgi:hypothetical protein
MTLLVLSIKYIYIYISIDIGNKEEKLDLVIQHLTSFDY